MEKMVVMAKGELKYFFYKNNLENTGCHHGDW